MANEKPIEPERNQSTVDRIIEYISGTILSGKLKPGDKIPTETELSDSLGVGRNSVREAVKSLVVMGVLNIRRREGTFVADGFSSRMLEPMAYGFVLEGGNSPAMLELRYVVDTGVMQLAIDKATGEDMDALGLELEKLGRVIRETPTAEAIYEADLAFHAKLESIARNPMLDKISMIIDRIARPTRIQALDEMIRSGDLDYLYALHKTIYDVICEQDRAGVSSVMDRHFGYWRKELKKQEVEN